MQCDAYGVVTLISNIKLAIRITLSGKAQVVRVLGEVGAKVNKRLTKSGAVPGATPLFVASGNSDAGVVRLLGALRADANVTNSAGITPIFFALTRRHYEVVRALAELGGDVNKGDRTGVTPSLFACREGNTDAVRMLGELGADFNSPDNEGCTCALIASSSGHYEVWAPDKEQSFFKNLIRY